jgi:hypothetical protein
LGGLSLFVSLIVLLSLAADPQQLADQLLASAPPETRHQLQQFDVTKIVHIFILVVGGIAAFVGISLVGSAFFVRRGSLAASIYAIIIVSLCCLWWIFNVLVGLIHLAGGAITGIVEMLFSGCICFAFGLCLYWLFGAARAIRFAANHRTMAVSQIGFPPGHSNGYAVQTSAQIPPPPQSPAR